MNFLIDTIRIPQTKGLKKTEIKSLGKINVLCGKNNSGKTTILEGINKVRREIKLRILSGIKDDIVKLIISIPDVEKSLEKIKQGIDDFIESQKDKLWQKSDNSIFWTNLNFHISKKWGREFTGFVLTEWDKLFQKLFNETFLFIPPNRNPICKVAIKTHLPLNPEGEGLINYLFACKNSGIESLRNKNFKEIQKAFRFISDGYEFDIVVEAEEKLNNEIILKFSNDGFNWRTAADCGFGLRDLLLILTYSITNEANVLLIEEPENHMNPEMQRKLLNYLKNDTEKQYIMSTHSNIFLDDAYVDKIFYTYTENNEVKFSDATSKALILNQLGYLISDNLVSDLIILTEGPKDWPALEEFLMKMGLIPKYNVKFWPLGGDIMGQLDLSVFIDNYKVIAIIDNDPVSNKVRENFMEKCSKFKIPVRRLERYAIENYFTLDSLKVVFGKQFPSTVTEIKPMEKLENQITINVKNNNRKIAQVMTIDNIKGTDLFSFLEEVEKILNSNKMHAS